MARLRSQNGLGQNGFSSVKKAMPCSLLLGTPYPICLESFLKNIYLFIYLFLAVLGLRCCARSFSSCGKRGLLFVAVCGLLIAVASLVAEHGL